MGFGDDDLFGSDDSFTSEVNTSDGADYWSNTDQYADDTQSDYWNNQEQFVDNTVSNETQTVEPAKLGYKMVAVIVAGVFVILALILLGLGNMNITKKKQTQTNQQTQTSQQTQNTQQVDKDSVSLVEIPNNYSLDYNGQVYEANGTVVDKVKYLIGNQVVYDVVINISVGSSSERVNFYCNYSSFSAVNIGDLVTVKYQQVQEGYISVNEIVK